MYERHFLFLFFYKIREFSMWVLMKRKERDGPTCILLLKRKELMARPWRPSYAPSIEKEMYPRMLTLFSLFIGLMAHKNPSLGHQPVKRKENNHARVTFDRQPEVEGLEGPIEGPTGGYPFFHEDLSPALQRSWKKEAISRQWHRMLVFPFQELLLDPHWLIENRLGSMGREKSPIYEFSSTVDQELIDGPQEFTWPSIIALGSLMIRQQRRPLGPSSVSGNSIIRFFPSFMKWSSHR